MSDLPRPHAELTRAPADLSEFWVITVISNPVRYKRRYELYWRFAELCAAAGVKLVTVEQAFGDRPFMVTKKENPYHLQVRGSSEIWLKENLINLGIRHALAVAPRLGLKVREVAWIDADCRPTSTPRHWFEEIWHQLQHHKFVQCWEWLIDLDVNHNAIGVPQPSFMANYIKYGSPNPSEIVSLETHHKSYPAAPGVRNIFGRPGLAWAARLDALNSVGGLIDFAILGAGDWYMAWGLVGGVQIVSEARSSSAYARALLNWQERAERWVRRDVGFVPGTVLHDFHGKKINRGYNTRGKILTENAYNPTTDIKYDAHGVLQLEAWEPRQLKMRDQIRAYFRSRNEDSIDI